MSLSEYKQFDGIGLAELVKNKDVLPSEIVAQSIKVIEEKNPQLNAVIHTMYDSAISTAQNVHEGPFAGVPILLKDITQEIEGQPLSSGSKLFQTYRSKKDSEFVRRVRQTGSLFMGQTNVPELALMGITESELHGPTRNPWNTNHTPGGSSGGSAAAVASGMVPIAGANDGGGSIRIPAAYCGLFGLKPTRGRTPAGPYHGRHWQGASVDHVLTRSVRDSAAMLDAIHGPEKGGAFIATAFEGSYLSCVRKPLKKKLTIAFTMKSPLGTEVHPECQKAVSKAIQVLESMGHHIEEKEAPVSGQRLAKSYINMYFGEVAATLAVAEEQLGRKIKKTDVEPTTWLLGLLGKVTSAEEFVLHLREWDKAAFLMEEFHEKYDLYLTPTTAYPPAIIGELGLRPIEKMMISLVSAFHLGTVLKKSSFIDQLVETSLKRTPFTQLANLTGQPAMTLPVHQTKDGLPCGAQFMAARGKEDLLFNLAGQLEQSEFWLKPSMANKLDH